VDLPHFVASALMCLCCSLSPLYAWGGMLSHVRGSRTASALALSALDAPNSTILAKNGRSRAANRTSS
jgi:hypothetical protein